MFHTRKDISWLAERLLVSKKDSSVEPIAFTTCSAIITYNYIVEKTKEYTK
jgi:hypothetical protein